VGVVPRRNPELVIAVLWEHGEFSYFPARLGARIVSAYVEKQRRLQNNLMPVKAPNPKPVEVGAVWTTPNPAAGAQGEPPTKMQAGKFYVGASGTVAGATVGSAASKSAASAKAAPVVTGAPKNLAQSGQKSYTAPSLSGQLRTAKLPQPGSESAKLGPQPALPAKPAQVKSQ
jgi:hypothetical protein